jgi:hypothetical protein
LYLLVCVKSAKSQWRKAYCSILNSTASGRKSLENALLLVSLVLQLQKVGGETHTFLKKRAGSGLKSVVKGLLLYLEV